MVNKADDIIVVGRNESFADAKLISYPDFPWSGKREISHFDIPESIEIWVRD